MEYTYPNGSWRYHRDGRAVIIYNSEQEKALGEGWQDRPWTEEEKQRLTTGGKKWPQRKT